MSSTHLDSAQSLPECHERLLIDMGSNAPALVTLKRWSSSGKLASALVGQTRGRKRYRYSDVLKQAVAASSQSTTRIAKRARLNNAAAEGIQRADRDGDAITVLRKGDLDDLKGWLGLQIGNMASTMTITVVNAVVASIGDREISAALTPAIQAAIDRQGEAITKAIQNIESLRVTMMNKYDAENNDLRSRLAAASLRYEQLERQVGGLDATKLLITLRRVEDRLNELAQRD